MTLRITNTTYADANGPHRDCPLVMYDNICPRNGYSTQITGSHSIPASYPVTNLWNPSTAQGFKVTFGSGATVSIILDLQADGSGTKTYDYIALFGHNLGSAHYPVLLSNSDDGSTWTGLNYIPATEENEPIALYMNPSNKRFIKIEFDMSISGAGTIYVGGIKVGTALILQRRVFVDFRPTIFATTTELQNNLTESGQFSGAVVLRRTRDFTIEQKHQTEDFVREKLKPFIDHLNYRYPDSIKHKSDGGTFCYWWRPISRLKECAYCWSPKPPQPINAMSNGMMSWELQVQALF